MTTVTLATETERSLNETPTINVSTHTTYTLSLPMYVFVFKETKKQPNSTENRQTPVRFVIVKRMRMSERGKG